jgi:hypothetical protein
MNPQQKAEFMDAYRAAKPVLERLAHKLTKDLTATESALESPSFLELPNLGHRRTAKLADRKRLKEILKLLDN